MRLIASILAAICLMPLAARAESCTQISKLKEIPIKRGINTIKNFGAEGETATIVRAMRSNGNAHGHQIYLMTLEGNEVIGTANGAVLLDDVVKDEPFTGEAAIKSVRFARGYCDDKPNHTFMVTATRKFGKPFKSLYDDTLVEFQLFLLVPGGDVGYTAQLFVPVAKSMSSRKYVNSDLALFDKFGFSTAGTDADGMHPPTPSKK